MTCLYIICEGQSEAEFVVKALKPYIYRLNPNVNISAPILKNPKVKDQSHKGGRVNFIRLKKYIEAFNLQQECKITTLVDYYGLEHDFPRYAEIQAIHDVYTRIERLEHEIYSELGLPNVIPYIQIHEYEMFYFADVDNFILADAKLRAIKDSLIAVNTKINNPELINAGPDSAPSKRIEDFFRQQIQLKYKKPYYASLYAVNSNIDTLRSKCTHFNEWVEKLIQL